jgi:hypothetical protein
MTAHWFWSAQAVQPGGNKMTKTYEELLQEVRRLQDTGALPSHPTRDQRADWAFGNTKIENSDVTREMAERAVDQKADDKG